MRTKRLFYAFSVEAPWPNSLPKARLLRPRDRHLTVAFLGNVEDSDVLTHIPKPELEIGIAGMFDRALFFTNVTSWHAECFESIGKLEQYSKELISWLEAKGYQPANPERPFLPHVTIGRKPFNVSEWKKAFTPLPFYLSGFHLYESVGHLTYESVWSYPLLPPFEEKKDTTCHSYLIRGKNLTEIARHALIALAFKEPKLLATFGSFPQIEGINDLENALIEASSGTSIKAVASQGELLKRHSIYEWRMLYQLH